MRRLKFCLLFLLPFFLVSCTHDITACTAYSSYLVAIRSLIDSSSTTFLPFYVFIWSIILLRKIFFI